MVSSEPFEGASVEMSGQSNGRLSASKYLRVQGTGPQPPVTAGDLEASISEHTEAHYIRSMSLFLASATWTLFMTAFPVMVDLPEDLYKRHYGWYVGNDIIRLMEPIGSLPLNFWILHASGVFRRTADHPPLVAVSLFMIGAAIYQQGAAFHSAAVMFKHPVKQIRAANPELALINDLYEWIRRVWEHDISHYMYALGGVIMAAVHAWVFKDDELRPHGFVSKRGRVVWLLASLAYGVIIGSVAIQFPMGSAICLTFLILYGFGVIGTYYIRLEGISRATPLRQWWSWGRRPVLQYFLQAYMVALTMVVAWIAVSRGFVGRNGGFR